MLVQYYGSEHEPKTTNTYARNFIVTDIKLTHTIIASAPTSKPRSASYGCTSWIALGQFQPAISLKNRCNRVDGPALGYIWQYSTA